MRFISIFAALVAVASAYTPPNYSNPPSGNPIALPGLNEQVPAGKPYTITWTPTTPGTVALVLLRGPSTNVVPIQNLADGIPNSGHFEWTPDVTLTPDVTHYGLLLVVEGTGQYQWSTQFGISKADDASPPPVTAPSTPPVTGTPTTFSTKVTPSPKPSSFPVSSFPVSSFTTSIPTYKPSTPPTGTSGAVAPTSKTSAPTPSSFPLSNGAGRNVVSLGAVLAVAVALIF